MNSTVAMPDMIEVLPMLIIVDISFNENQVYYIIPSHVWINHFLCTLVKSNMNFTVSWKTSSHSNTNASDSSDTKISHRIEN